MGKKISQSEHSTVLEASYQCYQNKGDMLEN